MTVVDDSLDRRGVVLGIGAYTLWGFFPAFWALLDPASPPEVLAHRVVWTAVLLTAMKTAAAVTVTHPRRPIPRR